MKKCSKCQVEKLESEFHKNSKATDKLQRRCKSCNIELNKARYNNSTEEQTLRKNRAKLLKRNLSNLALKIKSLKGCCNCSENDPVCLDFHHLDSNKKDFTVSRVIGNKNLDKIVAEIKKCTIVCSNCHRKIHAGTLVLTNFTVYDDKDFASVV